MWWSWVWLSSSQNAFFSLSQLSVQSTASGFTPEKLQHPYRKYLWCLRFFQPVTHSEHRTSSLRSEWDCSPNELVQHINLLALVNACSVPRACNGTKIPGALLVLNSLKESLKFLSACCSLTSFVKNLEICIWNMLCILGLAQLVRICPWQY